MLDPDFIWIHNKWIQTDQDFVQSCQQTKIHGQKKTSLAEGIMKYFRYLVIFTDMQGFNTIYVPFIQCL